MFDELRKDLVYDENLYSQGSIAGYNVAVGCLPAGHIGNNPTAPAATQMRVRFKGIRFGLMVAIGGGVPIREADIRLGDLVVSLPRKTFGGVAQYDLGKVMPSGFERTGLLSCPPQILLNAISRPQASDLRGRNELSTYLFKLKDKHQFQRLKAGLDVLFEPTYEHKGGQTCDLCRTEKREAPQPRESEEVVVHYETIASGNHVTRDGRTRDKVSQGLGGILCFEMEAADLMNSFPCLVIRGICDYAETHKNKNWQPYTAATAAAYGKVLLSVIPTTEVARSEAVGGRKRRFTDRKSWKI